MGTTMSKHNTTSILIEQNQQETYLSTATQNIWLYDEKDKGLQNFALPRPNNKVKSYVQSYDYYNDLVTAVRDAEKEVYITGWQVNWDALITPELRLVDLLCEVVTHNKNLMIYILPWKDVSPVDTGDEESRNVLRNYINEYVGREAISVRLHESNNDELSPVTGLFFSHHQKCVIIDRKKAFVGGIDIAYGRYGNGYDLNPNKDNRHSLNRYNPCVELLDNTPKEETIPFNPKNFPTLIMRQDLQREIFEKKHWAHSDKCLASNQPIMPWQDIHTMIEGKAVFDLVLNFVLRWNSATSNLHQDKPFNVSTSCIYRWLTLPTQKEFEALPEAGSCTVQILRSASVNMRNNEAKSTYFQHKKSDNVTVRINTNSSKYPQDDIYQTMLNLINKAKRFIYIENQFFISEYGQAEKDPVSDQLSVVANSQNGFSPWVTTLFSTTAKELPQNKIVEALANKISEHIFAYDPTPFHIYITLPVHPEGLLNNGSIIAQVNQTMQTISFGSNSLLNRIRKHLWVYQQLIQNETPRSEWSKLRAIYYDKIVDQHHTIPLEACDKYVTLLNLRSWGELEGNCVTEQIYVHSKLTIVDDLYVLVGSANINDRSLLGTRDSELAALIVDNNVETVTNPITGEQLPVRHFARELRLKIWQGLFGDRLDEAINIPELTDSITAIQTRARNNTKIFEDVFPFIPRNYLFTSDKKIARYKNFASIWPILDNQELKQMLNASWNDYEQLIKQQYIYNKQLINKPLSETYENAYKQGIANLHFKKILMPFNQVFWDNYAIKAVSELNKIKGYITLLPIHWTQNENNAIPYHTRLIS